MNKSELKVHITRLDRFSNRLKSKIMPQTSPFEVRFAPCDGETTFDQLGELDFKPISIGNMWGKNWQLAWFHLKAQVPTEWKSLRVAARLDLTGEGLVFDSSGNIVQGITQGSVFDGEFSRDTVRLIDKCKGGETIELWVEATASDLFGLGTKADPDDDDPYRHGLFEARVKAAELAVFDSAAWALWLDVEIVRGMIEALPESSVRRARVLKAATEMIDAFETGADIESCRKMLAAELNRPAESSTLGVTAVGHAHIDTAWLWPVRETIRKCARTFSSQLSLIDRYPDYIFGASQAQLYAFVKEHYPSLYKRIKKAVADGRWEIQGGMWVEADCNLISGESMVRQFLHGKNFFKDEFGVDVDNLWLPDVFGYSAAMPQILQKSGVAYFLTQKMSWNQLNRFPYHTFVWKGIDGSSVLSHFPPEDTYNSSLKPAGLIRAAERFNEKDFADEFLFCISLERQSQRNRLEQGDTQRIDIGSGIDFGPVSGEQFGGHVFYSPNEIAGAGHPGYIIGVSDAEVGQLKRNIVA